MPLIRKNFTDEERALMVELREQGLTYRQIAERLGRTYNGVRCALNPQAAARSRQYTRNRRAEQRKSDPVGYLERQRINQVAFHRRKPQCKMLYGAKAAARKKGVPFNLVEADIVIPEFCPVLGIKLNPGADLRCDESPSLDRLVPSLGYVRGNVNVISWRANFLKSDATAEELVIISNWMAENGAA